MAYFNKIEIVDAFISLQLLGFGSSQVEWMFLQKIYCFFYIHAKKGMWSDEVKVSTCMVHKCHASNISAIKKRITKLV